MSELLEVRQRLILVVESSPFHGSACHRGPTADIQMPAAHFSSLKPLLSHVRVPEQKPSMIDALVVLKERFDFELTFFLLLHWLA